MCPVHFFRSISRVWFRRQLWGGMFPVHISRVRFCRQLWGGNVFHWICLDESQECNCVDSCGGNVASANLVFSLFVKFQECHSVDSVEVVVVYNFVKPNRCCLQTGEGGGIQLCRETYICCFWIQFSCDCDSVEGQKLVLSFIFIFRFAHFKIGPPNPSIYTYTCSIMLSTKRFAYMLDSSLQNCLHMFAYILNSSLQNGLHIFAYMLDCSLQNGLHICLTLLYKMRCVHICLTLLYKMVCISLHICWTVLYKMVCISLHMCWTVLYKMVCIYAWLFSTIFFCVHICLTLLYKMVCVCFALFSTKWLYKCWTILHNMVCIYAWVFFANCFQPLHVLC